MSKIVKKVIKFPTLEYIRGWKDCQKYITKCIKEKIGVK